MTPALLRACGRALYGERFVAPLAARLGYHKKTLHRWLDGEFNPPADLPEKLLPLLLERRGELADLILSVRPS